MSDVKDFKKCLLRIEFSCEMVWDKLITKNSDDVK